jgi:hypothetical protein
MANLVFLESRYITSPTRGGGRIEDRIWCAIAFRDLQIVDNRLAESVATANCVHPAKGAAVRARKEACFNVDLTDLHKFFHAAAIYLRIFSRGIERFKSGHEICF